MTGATRSTGASTRSTGAAPAQRHALVTGASRGIGLAIARALATAGYRLIITGRDEERLVRSRDSLRDTGATVRMVAGDISDDAYLAELAEQAAQRPLAVAVLAAGVGYAGGFADFPIHRWDRQFAVNVRAPFQLMQRLLPALRAGAELHADTGAKVIAIASLAGVVAEPELAAYGAAKSALISLCESLTVAEGANGVTATAISPGYVDTDMSTWKHNEIAGDEMIRAADIAELTMAVCRISRHAAIPNVVLTRPGSGIWRA